MTKMRLTSTFTVAIVLETQAATQLCLDVAQEGFSVAQKKKVFNYI